MDLYFEWTGYIDWRGIVGIAGKTGDNYNFCLGWQDGKDFRATPLAVTKTYFVTTKITGLRPCILSMALLN
jgi:hypothetical protein